MTREEKKRAENILKIKNTYVDEYLKPLYRDGKLTDTLFVEMSETLEAFLIAVHLDREMNV